VKLLDTTIAIDHLRGDDRATHLLERLSNEGEPLLASELSRVELLAGMRPDELDGTELFMGALTWVPVNEEIARVAGSMAAQYRSAHRGIDAIDYLIAATAAVVDAELLTTNLRHFPMITGLRPPYAT
jgi:predicted nucleic acid-binding protein